ncbi:MAG: hypothetical protein KJO69_04050, partial [Gammaproteobacteria bacterium]|nr:hypothetical protein [Gammaproteobacteria bacterium]
MIDSRKAEIRSKYYSSSLSIQDIEKSFTLIPQKHFPRMMSDHYGMSQEEADQLKSKLVMDQMFTNRHILFPPPAIYKQFGNAITPSELLILVKAMEKAGVDINSENPFSTEMTMEGLSEIMSNENVAKIIAKTPAYLDLKESAIQDGIIPQYTTSQGKVLLTEGNVPKRIWKNFVHKSFGSRLVSLDELNGRGKDVSGSVFNRPSFTNIESLEEGIELDEEEQAVSSEPIDQATLNTHLDLDNEPMMEFLFIADHALRQNNVAEFQGNEAPIYKKLDEIDKPLIANTDSKSSTEKIIKRVTMEDLFNNGNEMDGGKFISIDSPILKGRVMYREFHPLQRRFLRNRSSGPLYREMEQKVIEAYQDDYNELINAAKNLDYLTAYNILVKEGFSFARDIFEDSMAYRDRMNKRRFRGQRAAQFTKLEILRKAEEKYRKNNLFASALEVKDAIDRLDARLRDLTPKELSAWAKTLEVDEAAMLQKADDILESQRPSHEDDVKRHVASEILKAMRLEQKIIMNGDQYRDNETLRAEDSANNEVNEAFRESSASKEIPAKRISAKARAAILSTHYVVAPAPKTKEDKTASESLIKTITFNASTSGANQTPLNEKQKEYDIPPVVTMAGMRIVMTKDQIDNKFQIRDFFMQFPSFNEVYSQGRVSKSNVDSMLNTLSVIASSTSPEAKSYASNALSQMKNDNVHGFIKEMHLAIAAYTMDDFYDMAVEGRNKHEEVDKIATGISSLVDHVYARIKRAFPVKKSASRHMMRIISMFERGMDGKSGINEYKSDTKAFRGAFSKFFDKRPKDGSDGVVLGLMQAFSFTHKPDQDGNRTSVQEQLGAYGKALESSISFYEETMRKAAAGNSDAQKKMKAEEGNYKKLLQVRDRMTPLIERAEKAFPAKMDSTEYNDITDMISFFRDALESSLSKSETEMFEFVTKKFSNKASDYHASKILSGNSSKKLRRVENFAPISVHIQNGYVKIDNAFGGMNPNKLFYKNFDQPESSYPDVIINLDERNMLPRAYNNMSYQKNVGTTLSFVSEMYANNSRIEEEDGEQKEISNLAAIETVAGQTGRGHIKNLKASSNFVVGIMEELNQYFKHERSLDSWVDKVMGVGSKMMYVRGLVSLWQPHLQYTSPMASYTMKRLAYNPKDGLGAVQVFKESIDLMTGAFL